VQPTNDPLTLTRQDLYELVWSKPLVELAKDFGLSDVALAKRCRKLAIPVPGRGYWARVAAGQAPRQPPLKKREDQPLDYSALSFSAPREPSENRNSQPPGTAEEVALRERIATLRPSPGTDHNPASPSVKRTAVLLKRPWRREITWSRGDKSGPVTRIETSSLVADRALRLADQLLVSASMVDWQFQAPPKPEESNTGYRRQYAPLPDAPVYGCLFVEGEPLAFRIDERHRQVDHFLTEYEKEQSRRGRLCFPPRWDLVPTGELRLHLLHTNSTSAIRTWKDSAKRPLEEQINAVLLGFLKEALDIKDRREELRRAEFERRRREELEWRQTERRSANAELIHELEAQAGAWLCARFLRSYLRALKRTLGEQRVEASLEKQPVDFLAWAAHYVDQLDPLSPTPHDADLMDENPRRCGNEEGVRQTLSRLMGRHWQEAWKLGETTDQSEDETLRADMVFDD
jgi:hypothetical protein